MTGGRPCPPVQPPIPNRAMQRSVSIAFQTDKPITAYGPLAKTVEDFGFSGVSVYNDMLYQPAWLPLLEIARHTTRVRIGPAAVNPFTCHPINIAGNIALLDEASHGRAYLSLARGAWLDFVGVRAQRPVTAPAGSLRLHSPPPQPIVRTLRRAGVLAGRRRGPCGGRSPGPMCPFCWGRGDHKPWRPAPNTSPRSSLAARLIRARCRGCGTS